MQSWRHIFIVMLILSPVFGLLCDHLLLQNKEALKTCNCLGQNKKISASLRSTNWFPITLKVFISISRWLSRNFTYLPAPPYRQCVWDAEKSACGQKRPTIRLPSHVFVLVAVAEQAKMFPSFKHVEYIQQRICFRRELKLCILAGGCKHRANTSVVDAFVGAVNYVFNTLLH